MPAGSRIGSVVGCLGNGTVSLTTTPASKAFQKISCNSDPVQYSELVTEDPSPVASATTFEVKVVADAASRWDVAVFATSKAPGQG